ncbi:MAG: hypothetical protein HYW62_00455 [Candidatus Levybacteria bacterium]|nr:hypothetical protein [Candidatus Levybacteria bacterium]
MIGTKEAVSRTFPETLSGEQNSFVGFIDQNRDLFERHTSSTYELRDERDGWRNSPTISEVAHKHAVLSLPLRGGHNASPPNTREWKRHEERIRDAIDREIFSSPDGKNTLPAKRPPLDSIWAKTTPLQRAEIQELMGRTEEFQADFLAAIAPLAAEVEQLKEELFSNFKNYLFSDPDGIFAVRDFLTDKKFASQRETIRPFLASFVQSEDKLAKDGKRGILGETVKKWADEISKRVTPVLVDEFVESIRNPNVLEWLEFAANMPISVLGTTEERDKDLIRDSIVSFLKSRPDVSFWPPELKKALSSFASSKYATARSSVEKGLEGFRRPLSSKPAPQIHLEPEKKIEGAPVQEDAKKEPDDKKGASEKAEKRKYPIGILTKESGSSHGFDIRVLTEEELKDFLREKADSFASSDLKMAGDFRTIVASLREDPYGFGTKKLNNMSVGIGKTKSSPIRSMDPGKRIGLHLEHPESQKIRIAYVIYGSGDDKVIVIEGIYSHDDYDSKFGA